MRRHVGLQVSNTLRTPCGESPSFVDQREHSGPMISMFIGGSCRNITELMFPVADEQASRPHESGTQEEGDEARRLFLIVVRGKKSLTLIIPLV